MLLHLPPPHGAQPLAGTAGGLSVTAAAPLVLLLELGDDERLDQAALTIRRSPVPDAAPPAVVLDTSAGGSTTNVAWVVAAWGQARQVEGLSLVFTNKPNPLVVRVHVARGDSAWFLAPGPHTLVVQAAMQLSVVLPDVVAERVMIEFLDEAGVSVPVSLSPASPPSVVLGAEPRELSLAVRGRRPMLRWNGVIPEGAGVVVDDLYSRLVAELRGELGAPGVALELRAAVAGAVELEWTFGAVRLAEQFPGGAAVSTLEIPWSGTVDQPLLASEAGPVQVESLALTVAADPVAERLVVETDAASITSHGQLVGSLYDAAQAIVLPSPCLLAGVDALVRAPDGAAALVLGLHADDRGRPATSSIVELAREVVAPTSTATWIAFDCPAPVPVIAGTWWVVLRAENGELVWLTCTSASRPALLVRRDRGHWLPRTSTSTTPPVAVLQVRAASEPPAAPLSLSLRGIAAGGTEPAWEAPLTLGEDGTARWAAPTGGAPPPATELSLRVTASVACTAALSTLKLRYRP